MLNVIFDGLIIAFSICYIIDISGIMGKINQRVFSLLYGKKTIYNGWYIPLFGCSKCLVFWVVLLWGLLSTDIYSIYIIGTAVLLSYIAPILSKLMNWLIFRLSKVLD